MCEREGKNSDLVEFEVVRFVRMMFACYIRISTVPYVARPDAKCQLWLVCIRHKLFGPCASPAPHVPPGSLVYVSSEYG